MSLARTLVVLVGLTIVGLIGYQIGIAQNVAAQLPAGGAPPVYYGYPYHWGFGFGLGFLGLLFPILFFFLIFGLVRAAFWGGRGWGGSHWADRRARLEELHRELHGEKPASGTDQRT